MPMIRPVLFAFLLLLMIALPARGGAVGTLHSEGDHFTYTDGNPSSAPIKGILVKPQQGKPPFPAILISHGLGGNADRFSLAKAREFSKWGFVCIGPDYTHAEPKGDQTTFGARPENLRRAKACLDALASMPDVDSKHVCAYGNSMGAFLTIALAAEQPDRLCAAAITAGGVVPGAGFAAPSVEQAGKIKTPFLILHGSADTTVPPQRSATLADILKEHHVECERQVYEGVDHNLHNAKAQDVNARIQAWFKKATAAPSAKP
jgi:dienelactone hydrolase